MCVGVVSWWWECGSHLTSPTSQDHQQTTVSLYTWFSVCLTLPDHPPWVSLMSPLVTAVGRCLPGSWVSEVLLCVCISALHWTTVTAALPHQTVPSWQNVCRQDNLRPETRWMWVDFRSQLFEKTNYVTTPCVLIRHDSLSVIHTCIHTHDTRTLLKWWQNTLSWQWEKQWNTHESKYS